MQSGFVQDILLPAGILGTLLGALVGLGFGICAWTRTQHYTGESARFLRLLRHHILEPSITICSGLLAALIHDIAAGVAFLPLLVALISFLSMFAPLCCGKWETPMLRQRNNQLKGWVVARLATCIATWIAGVAIGGAQQPIDIITSCVYLAGVIVLWASIISGALALRAFPRIARTDAPLSRAEVA